MHTGANPKDEPATEPLGQSVSIRNLSFGYNKKSLFENLGMDLSSGRIYGLLGLNGAGKTTLMKLITGLIFANDGDVRVLNDDPSRRNPDFLADIFVLSEELKLPSISEREYMLSRAPFYSDFNYGIFEECIKEFDIPRSKRLEKLSFGQKKKFMLSFGLASGSRLLIMDEPTNGLDIPSRGLFRRLVAKALTEDRTFIISTHQVRDLDSLIDSVIILNQGRVLFSDTMEVISEKVRMTRTSMPPAPGSEGLVYTEAVVGGHWSVWDGGDADGGPIDLEVLFNAVIAAPHAFKGGRV